MQICGIICEYNPLHAGHKYQLDQVKELHPNTQIICVMSGDFTQRATAAIADKFTRAKAALKAGADAVIELPAAYATANAQIFAHGGISILSQIDGVERVVCGCETANNTLLTMASDIQLDENSQFRAKLKEELDGGQSYPMALSAATAHVMEQLGYDKEECAELLSNPNNILAIEYTKWLKRIAPNITIEYIRRIGDRHDKTEITSRYPSASAIRELIISGKDASDYTDREIIEVTRDYPVDTRLLDSIMLFDLIRADETYLTRIVDVKEGIHRRLKAAAILYPNLNEVLDAVKTKRYTYARLRRILLSLTLGVTDDIYKISKIPSRLLGIRECSKNILSCLPKEVITRASQSIALNDEQQAIRTIDERAAHLYTLITKRRGNYNNKRLITI